MDTLLSIVTLYNWNNTLFDDMEIPVEVDKEILIDNILLELGELELLYNDFDMMKFAIGRWSKKELKVWNDLYETTILEYNPIENYNRTETRNLQTTVEGQSETADDESTSGGDTLKKYANSYDSETQEQTEQETSELGSINNRTVNTDTQQTGTDTGEINTKGNIGVTTTQQMIEQERKTVKFNIYDYIINSFKMRFCILIY